MPSSDDTWFDLSNNCWIKHNKKPLKQSDLARPINNLADAINNYAEAVYYSNDN